MALSKEEQTELQSLACQGVQGLKAYEPGKPIEELEREYGLTDVVKLASNENPLGISSNVKSAIEKAISDISLYPDGNAFYLKQAIANKLSNETITLVENNITVGNGSNDILEIIAHCFADQNAEVIYSQHAFAVYPIVTQAIGAAHVVVPASHWGHDLDAMSEKVTDKTKLIFIANPNNPTGTWLKKNALYNFISNIPRHVIVVVDEAYHEFLDEKDYSSALSWLSEFPNLIVTRTFSKAYGLAGLRVGYSLSHPAISDVLNRVRQPFNVNSIALAAATAAIKDDVYLQKSVDINKKGMAQLVTAFEAMGLSYIPSVGNFVCIDVGCEGNLVYESLLKKGVIVRPVGPYQMPNFIRVSVGLEDQNTKFISALKSVLNELGVK